MPNKINLITSPVSQVVVTVPDWLPWSGVTSALCCVPARRRAIGFDEGPVFAESYQYLQNAGIDLVRGFMQREAKAVLDFYASSGGKIYNCRL